MICEINTPVHNSTKDFPRLRTYIEQRTKDAEMMFDGPIKFGDPDLVEVTHAMNGDGVYCPRCFHITEDCDVGDVEDLIGTRCEECMLSPHSTPYSVDALIPGEQLLRRIGMERAQQIWKRNLKELK